MYRLHHLRSAPSSLLRASPYGSHLNSIRCFTASAPVARLSPMTRMWGASLPDTVMRAVDQVLALRLPKGFGSGDDKDDSVRDSDSKAGAGGGGGDGDGDDGGDKKNKKDSDDDGQQMQELGMGAALLAVIASLYFSRSKDSAGNEVTWQDLRNKYLAQGWVEKMEVINKEKVVVYLRKTPLHPEGAQDAGFDPSSDTSSSSPPTGPNGEKYSRVFFKIGSVDSFERQLEDAQLDLGIHPRDFIPVKYSETLNLGEIAVRMLPTLFFVGFWIFLMRRMGSGGGAGNPFNKMFSIGKANATTAKDTKSDVRFKDVAGCDEAKREIMEFVQFLKDPSRFTKLGAKIPKGALLVGPPGTGKTLLAKATAGEADVPFFSMSGSDFIEMFVGVGPSRVRDLFKQAREASPCIVFIDEIDAVARSRSKGGFSGGNDERENTLNQLLVEMDGFKPSEGVVVLGGTNRVDILDQAILRPGRFDRQVMVDLPDINGRKTIFEVHQKPLTISGDPDEMAKRLASLTPGFSGADIANVCNEAAIVAARRTKDAIDMGDFEAAIDRVIGGLVKDSSLLDPEERRTVAYHEAGHAVSGWFLEHADPLLKVTIVPRSSGALGFAQYLPKELKLFTKEAMMDKISMALGGRVAEELEFGRITTGAADDLDKVTQMAYAMTTIYGMNENVGRLSFPPKDETQFKNPYSDKTAELIDGEVRSLVDEAYERTRAILTEHSEGLKALAELLLERETISQHDVVKILGPRPFEASASMAAYTMASGFDPVDHSSEPDVIEDGEKEAEESKKEA